MKAFKRILFPVDLSDVSPKIVPWVVMVAERFGAEICLLFVVREFNQYASFSVVPGAIEKFEEKIIKGAETKIEEFSRIHLKEYSHCKTKVAHGDPSEEILDDIIAEKIDLVIMGTHGRKGLNRIVFGSVADRVVKMSPVPVLTINPYRVQKNRER